VKARHPAAGEMEVKAHLVVEGILVHRQRHIRDCLRRVASEQGQINHWANARHLALETQNTLLLVFHIFTLFTIRQNCRDFDNCV